MRVPVVWGIQQGLRWPSHAVALVLPSWLATRGVESAHWSSVLVLVCALVIIDFVDLRFPSDGFTSADGALLLASSTQVGLLPAVVAAVGARLCVGAATRNSEFREVAKSVVGFAVAALVAGAALAGVQRLWPGVPVILVVIGSVCIFYLIDTRLRIPRTTGIDSTLARRAMETEIRRQFPILAAYASASGLFLLLLPSIGNWAYLPIVALIVVIRQSYALLASTQSAYISTLGVIVEACEADGPPEQHGRAERIRQLARALGAEAGLPARELDVLSETALLESLYDNPTLGADSESEGVPVSLGEVSFLAPCVSVIGVLRGDELESEPSSSETRMAAVLATATLLEDSRIGGTTNPRFRQYLQALDSRVSTRILGAAARLGHRVEL